MTPAQRMMDLFGGHKNSYGTHGEPELDANGLKWKIKKTAESIRKPVTVNLWESHIKGIKPLGIVPIDEDSKCRFGSIDVDDYEIDVLSVIKNIEDLPLIPCRSKSGGLHLFLFTQEPVDASIMQTTLRNLAASLGFADCEIFPKQSKLLSDRGEMGSWIIMPYYGDTFNGKLKFQHGLKKTGAEMTLSEFIKEVNKKAVTLSDLQNLQVKKAKTKKEKTEKSEFMDGPPCLQHLIKQPIGQGGQNNTLFHMGVYYKKAHPDSWKTKLEEANQKYMSPVHPTESLMSVIRSLEKTDYQYKCQDQPMCQHCDSMLCRTRKFGVGTANAYPIITNLQKMETDPPVWFATVEDKSIMLSTYELQNYMAFHKLCMENTNRCFGQMKQTIWLGVVAEAMENLEQIPAPPEVGVAGIFLELLETFLTNRQRGDKVEDLLSGRPFEDEENELYYFRLQDLQKFLHREGMKDMTRPQIIARIRTLGGEHKQFNIKNKHSVNAWSVSSKKFNGFPVLDTPQQEESEI